MRGRSKRARRHALVSNRNHAERRRCRRSCRTAAAKSVERPTQQTNADGAAQQRSRQKRANVKGGSRALARVRPTGRQIPPEASPSVTMEGFPNDEVSLPGCFVVKYLGVQDATGLWGLKHTRRAVDDLVAAAKSGKLTSAHMPMVKLEVSEKGVTLIELGAAAAGVPRGSANNNRLKPSPYPTSVGVNGVGGAPVSCVYPIECISYGVQDVSYSKVVAMIVVRESASASLQHLHEHPFRCHAFVCESKAVAKRLTLTLAAAFREFSKMVKSTRTRELYTKKFAIDLRGEEDGECVPEDSEA